jgi:hypothetical protein
VQHKQNVDSRKRQIALAEAEQQAKAERKARQIVVMLDELTDHPNGKNAALTG